MRKRDSVLNSVKCVALLPIFALCGCSYLDNYHVEKAKQECAKFGSMQVIEPVTAEGFLRPWVVPGHYYYADDLVKDLTVRRYKYIEVPQPYHYEKKEGKRPTDGMIGRYVVGGKGDYFRFYLDDAGSEKCKKFDEDFQGSPTLYYPSLRQKGLPVSKCIAGERVEKPLSQYEMVVINKEDGEPFGDYEYYQMQYREIATKKIVAKLSHVQYKYRFSCYDRREEDKFFDFITAAPNEVLPPKNEQVNVYEPPPFEVSKEVYAALYSRAYSGKTIKEINRNYFNWKMKLSNTRMALDGLISLDALYYSGRSGFQYIGDALNIVGKGKTYKVFVQDGKITFDSLSQLSVDEQSISFVGYPTTFSKVDDDLRIFEYSLDGVPLAVYRVHFPDEIGFHRHSFDLYKLEKVESGFKVIVYKSEKDAVANVELLTFIVPR